MDRVISKTERKVGAALDKRFEREILELALNRSPLADR
jgi:hypothetical protein